MPHEQLPDDPGLPHNHQENIQAAPLKQSPAQTELPGHHARATSRPDSDSPSQKQSPSRPGAQSGPTQTARVPKGTTPEQAEGTRPNQACILVSRRSVGGHGWRAGDVSHGGLGQEVSELLHGRLGVAGCGPQLGGQVPVGRTQRVEGRLCQGKTSDVEIAQPTSLKCLHYPHAPPK